MRKSTSFNIKYLAGYSGKLISEEEIEKFLETLNKIEVNLKDKVVIQN